MHGNPRCSCYGPMGKILGKRYLSGSGRIHRFLKINSCRKLIKKCNYFFFQRMPEAVKQSSRRHGRGFCQSPRSEQVNNQRRKTSRYRPCCLFIS